MNTPTQIIVTVFTTKRLDCWVAYCPALKLYGFSQDSEGAALDDFDKSIEIFLEVQHEIGKIDETLTTLGWKRNKEAYSAPARRFTSTVSPFRGEGARSNNRKIPIPA
jgi:hypothetical protein